MRKSLIILTSLVSMFILTACGYVERSSEITESSVQVKDAYEVRADLPELAYQNFIPREYIVKGPAIAIQTIEDKIGRSVIHAEDFPDGASLVFGVVDEGPIQYMEYNVPKYTDDNIEVIFLYNDDTSAVIATDSDENFRIEDTNYNVSIKASWKDEKYHNTDNYCDDVFAWSYQGTANVVMYGTVTSAWEHNLDTDEVELIYCYRNCPIWSN